MGNTGGTERTPKGTSSFYEKTMRALVLFLLETDQKQTAEFFFPGRY